MPPSFVSVHVSVVYFVYCAVFIFAQDYGLDDKIQDSLKEESGSLSEWLAEGQKQAVPWSDLCPAPVQPHSASACNAPPCAANSECVPRHNHTYLCCFNGCIDTCMRALEPPPVFDWIDEPPDTKHFIVPGEMASHSSPPELVALPGGCVITPMQFHNLEGFKQNEHVSDCFCHVGAVFCKIVQ